MNCPRCGDPLPADAFYGPCATCRAALNGDANWGAAARAARVVEAEADGFIFDPGADRYGAYIKPEDDVEAEEQIAVDRAGAPARDRTSRPTKNKPTRRRPAA